MLLMKTEGRVCVTVEDHVAEVRLTRADKLNALDPAMFDAIIEAGRAVGEAGGVRAVVLSGEGRAFCAGLDTASFGREPDPGEPRLTERTHGNANKFQEVCVTWRKCLVPVIAAIHGVCFGGGLQIASGADIRIAAPDARLAIMELKWGLVPDMGSFPIWRDLLRDDVLRELVYTNRELSGEEAHRLGLITQLAGDPLARARELAGEIASRNPDAVRAAKRLLNGLHDQSFDEILLAESREQEGVIHKPNQIEAVMAAMGQRAPRFTD
jgi:enoyl-CoA hydratase/carnithine racemase